MPRFKASYRCYLEEELRNTKKLLSKINNPSTIASYLHEITLLENALGQINRQQLLATPTAPESNMPPIPSPDIPTSSANPVPPAPEPLIVPDKTFTLEELATNYNGLDGNPSYVSLYGIVFDVSNISTWGGGTHFGLYAGTDATENARACGFHNPGIIMRKMPAVGRLAGPLASSSSNMGPTNSIF